MNLIERYTQEVGRHLPQRMRADITRELGSTLQDMLDDRSQQSGSPADEQMVKDLLLEYGAPQAVAASYLPTRYLIGPRLYPFFTLVLKIVFAVLVVVSLVGLGVRLATAGAEAQSLFSLLREYLLGMLSGGIQAFGNIVLVFAILERFQPSLEFDEEKTKWHPDELLKDAEPEEIAPWEPVAGILFTAAALLIFNLYPQWLNLVGSINGVWFVGASSWADAQAVRIPLFSTAFFGWLPWISAVWMLEIVLHLLQLRQGRWSLGTRWFSIAINLAGVVLGVLMLSGPSIVGITPAALQSAGMPTTAAETIGGMLPQIARSIIGLVVVLQGVEAGKMVYRMVKAR